MFKEGINIYEVLEKIEFLIFIILGYVIDYIKEVGDNVFDINLYEFYNDEEEELI